MDTDFFLFTQKVYNFLAIDISLSYNAIVSLTDILGKRLSPMPETASNSAATRKETNRTRVIRQALACFVERGIEATRVSDVAALAGLTERSAFRYFETKADLVLETALLFWQEAMAHGRTAECLHETEALCGAAQIFPVLQGYAELYFTHRQELIFVHEAEAYLYRHGKALLMRSRPPAPFPARRCCF